MLLRFEQFWNPYDGIAVSVFKGTIIVDIEFALYVSGVLGSSGSGSGSSIMIDDNYPTFVSFVLLLNI